MAVKLFLQALKNAVINVFKYLVGIIVIVLFIPTSVIIFLPFILYRRLIFHSGRIFRDDLGKMVSSRGSLFLTEDADKSGRFKLVLGGVLHGRPSINELIQNARDALSLVDSKTGEPLYPELTQKIVKWMGYRFWKPLKNFRLEDHVVSVDDSIPLTVEEALQYMKAESLTAYPEESALWKLILVPNFIPNKSSHYYKEGEIYSFVIFTAHHAICDGFSILKLLDKVCNFGEKELLQVKMPGSSADVSSFQKFKKVLKFISRIPYDVGEVVTNLTSLSLEPQAWKKCGIPMSDVKVISASSPLIESLISLPCQPELEYIHQYSDLLEFSEFRKVSKSLNVSTFSVVLAAISRSVSTVMFKTTRKEDIPWKISLAIPYPVPGHPDKLRNHLCGVSFPLPFGEPDPIKQLHKIDNQIKYLKESTTPVIANVLALLYCSLPPAILYFTMKLSYLAHIISLSSFPGPKTEISAMNCTLKESYWTTSGISGSNAIGFGFTTYSGYGRLIVQGSPNIIGSEDTAADLIKNFSNYLKLIKTRC